MVDFCIEEKTEENGFKWDITIFEDRGSDNKNNN